MSVPYFAQHLEAFLRTLQLTEKELQRLDKSHSRLFQANTIDENWVNAFDLDDARQDTLEASASRFARLQDTIGDKLLPRLFLLVGENPGTFLDNLYLAKGLVLIGSAA